MKADKAEIRAWTRSLGKPAMRAATPAIICGILGALFALGQALAIARVLSCVLTETPGVMAGLIAFAVFAVLRAVLGGVQSLLAHRAGVQARRRLRARTTAAVLNEGPALLRRRQSGDIAAVLVDRIEALEGYFSGWMPASVLWIASPAIILFGLLTQDLEAALILGCCGAIVPVAQAAFGIGAAIASRKQVQALTRLQARFLDRMRGIATIVLAGAARQESEALARAADELRLRTMKVLRIAFLSSAAIDFAMVVALLLIVLTHGGVLLLGVASGMSDPVLLEHALFALILVPEFFAPLRALALAYQDRAQAQNAAEAMCDLQDANLTPPLQIKGRREGIALTLRDVSFIWDPARPPALDHISLTVQSGQVLVLTGASGAGKSTFIELLLGFVRPTTGQIFFDGQDMATLSAHEIAARTAWVGQRPMLFAGTLRDNLLFARPNASEGDMREAIRAAALEPFVASLPDGLDTMLGEHGHGVSGGQAQRIAIARAFLKDAPLLLLDEPTASLDPATEAEILVTLRLLAVGRTVVMCGHSAAVHGFEAMMVELDRGRIAHIGEAA